MSNETAPLPARRSVGDQMTIRKAGDEFVVTTRRGGVIVTRAEMEEHAAFILSGALDTTTDDMAAALRELSERCERLTKERDDALARLHEAERRHRKQLDGVALAACAGGEPC